MEPTGKVLGATIRGIDLSTPLSERDLCAIVAALARHGVICFPEQNLDAVDLRAFALQLGPVQTSEGPKEPSVPEISVLSNIVEDGRNIGAVDAGMIWHKDMTYQKDMGWATMLYAIEIPRRDGRSLGATRFANAMAAYDDLPDERKAKLKNAIGIHNSVMYNAKTREAGSKRAAYSEEKIKKKEPLPHPMVFTHPISGRTVLYCDPGHVERIDGLDDGEGAEMLQFLTEHQLQPQYQYAHEWTEGDVLMWDNISTLHCATLDYGPNEHRLMKRCQVVTPQGFDPRLVREALQATGV
ncbi:MAG TPA: TauD/TfdA family dioxygenase [Beijerinckiaceae bacterium]|nr:TauD/TfdA family dioxygenase [Beijerinckiaceae bacterium]